MSKNKYNFAYELLSSSRVTPEQKKRILALIAQERNEDIVLLENRIENLEKKEEATAIVEEIKIAGKKEEKVEVENALPKNYINPFGEKSLSNFLLAYNQDPLLKYTCHEVSNSFTIDDKDYNFIDYIKEIAKTDVYTVRVHQQLLQKRFEELLCEVDKNGNKRANEEGKKKKKYFISNNIETLILVYLTGKNSNGKKKEWSSNNIEMNWANEELLTWSDTHPNCVPHPDKTLKKKQKDFYKLEKTFISNLNGENIQDFSDLAIHFKCLFHIRPDNSLKDLLEYRNKTKWGQNIDFTFSKFRTDIELFTDVDKLLQIYDEILRISTVELIRTNSKYALEENEKHKITLSFYEVEKQIFFEIHHIHPHYPFYGKSSNNVIERVGEAHTNLINKVNGIADLYIQADFNEENKSYEINLWDGEWNGEKYVPKKRKKKEITKVDGVKYKLRLK